MGRVAEFVVMVNAIGGIAVTVAYFKAKARRDARRHEREKQADAAQKEIEKLKQMP